MRLRTKIRFEDLTRRKRSICGMCSLENPIKSSAMEGIQGSLVILLCYKLSQHEFFPFSSGSARGGSGIPIYPKKNRQNTPKYPKFLQIYPKIIEALNTLYPKLEVSETNTYLVVLPFLAFLQMDCHYFPTITDHKKRPHVSLNGKMVGYG